MARISLLFLSGWLFVRFVGAFQLGRDGVQPGVGGGERAARGGGHDRVRANPGPPQRRAAQHGRTGGTPTVFLS